LLLLASCGDKHRSERDVVASIEAPGGALELDRRVVEHIAARDGVSETEARERALDQLRLVAARRAELAERPTPPAHPDDLDDVRREHLEHAAMVRLWLDEVFEPAHTAATIPKRVVEQNLADPNLTRRLFHPELWFVCQALIMPRETNVRPPSEGEAAAAWQADAGRSFAPLVARIEPIQDDLIGDQTCGAFGRIVGASEREFESQSGALVIRFEAFAFAPTEASSFDRTWVEQVTARAEPRLIGPFSTQFGLHLVMVTKIEPAALADGSLPPEQLAAAREAELRSELEEAWRADQLQRTLADARDRRVVRLAGEID
jgi:plasmid stabilization system protein ParE